MDKEKLTDQALEKALQWAEAAEAFAVEQAPLVVEEIIAWGYAFYSIGVVIGFIFAALAIASVFVAKHGANRARQLEDEHGRLKSSDETKVFPFLIGGFAGCPIFTVISAVALLTNSYGLAYVYFAPRLYVLQELGRMIGN